MSIYLVLVLIILQFNSLPYDYLVTFIFLTDFYFTRRLPRSTLRLLKNKGALTVAQYYIGKHTCNVWSSDNTYDSNLVGAVLHLCVNYMYLWRTPFIRCSPHKLKLNLIKVAMFVLSNHLFRISQKPKSPKAQKIVIANQNRSQRQKPTVGIEKAQKPKPKKPKSTKLKSFFFICR